MNTYNFPWYYNPLQCAKNFGFAVLVTCTPVLEIKHMGKANPDIHKGTANSMTFPSLSVYGLEQQQLYGFSNSPIVVIASEIIKGKNI